MSTRVLLEGPAIEPLLAQVRDEYGSGVRIISADKVRSGGVGGFFAKQHYELSVEVPDGNGDGTETVNRTTTHPDNGPQTIERLLERAESQDRRDEPARPISTARSALGAGRNGETTFPRPGVHGQPAAQPTRPDKPSPDAEVSRGAAISDTGAAFAELMAGLDNTADPGIERNRPKAGVPLRGDEAQTVRPFRPAATNETPVNPQKTAAQAARTAQMSPLGQVSPTTQMSPAEASPTAAQVSPAALVEQTAQVSPAAQTSIEQVSPAPLVSSGPPAALVQSAPPAHLSLAERIGGLGASEVEIDEPPAQSAAEAYGLRDPEPAATVIRAPAVAARPADSDLVIENLMRVGMPAAMAQQITGADTYAGVLSVLASRPSAPGIPDGPGEILVLAGDINLGVPIGRYLLEQIGVPENHLLLAAQSTAGTGLHSSRLIPNQEAAESRVEKLHSAEQAWVVVMEAPVGGTDPLWVNEMCDAVGATAVWAIVDATRKTADTARHLRTLGEVEALVVHSVDLTADPASVLGLDLPVFSLDGKPATPHAWAAMLCARIASEVLPVAAVPRRATRAVRQ